MFRIFVCCFLCDTSSPSRREGAGGQGGGIKWSVAQKSKTKDNTLEDEMEKVNERMRGVCILSLLKLLFEG